MLCEVLNKGCSMRVVLGVLVGLFCSVFSIPPGFAQSRLVAGSPEQKVIQETDQKMLGDMQQYNIPGAVIALVNRDGIVWQKSYGYADMDKKQKIDGATLFSMESNSKMFTTLGALFAAQDNMLGLDDAVSKYVPDLRVRCAGHACSSDNMTIRGLLGHASGLMHEAPVGNNYDGAQGSFDEHIASILKESNWLLSPPNTQKSYSNMGIDVAGYVLQQVSHENFATYMEHQVLSPLGMSDSTFDPAVVARSTNKANGYVTAIGEIAGNKAMLPAGGLYASANDMAKYLQFQLNDGTVYGKQLLDKKWIEEMRSLAYPVAGQERGYALGLWRGIKNNSLFFMHLGRGFGFSSTVIWYPDLNYGVVVVLNQFGSNVDTDIANYLLDNLAKITTHPCKMSSGVTWQAQYIIPRNYMSHKLESSMLGNYLSSEGSVDLVFDDSGQFGIRGSVNEGPFGNIIRTGFMPLKYLYDNIFYSSEDDSIYIYKKATGTDLPYLLRSQDGYVWYLNRASSEPFGPNKTEWQQYVGTYEINTYGLHLPQTVHIQNGYLYFNDNELREISSGLFRMATGGIVDLRPGSLTFGNVKLTRDATKH